MSTNVVPAESRPAVEPGLHPCSRRTPAARPIARRGNATGGQWQEFPVTTGAKNSLYVSRPVATANYPQSCAGSRRRKTVWGVPGHCVIVRTEKVDSSTWLFL